MEGPPLVPGGEDITWPDQVAPRGRKASSTRKIKPQTPSPRPLYRGAGRPGAAVRVSGQWLAGCGPAGSFPRSLSPYSLPREVARSHASRRTMGGAWVGGPGSSPHSRASAVRAITCAAACVLSMGGVAPHTTPVRAHPASLGTICAASRCAGVGPLVLRGPHVSRRLGRGGGSHSGSPSRAGGGHSPCLRGRGPGPPRLAGWWGGGRGGGVAPRPPCSRSGRRPAVLLSGPLRVAGALPSGARVRSGLKCRPGVGGLRGGPWTAPPGAPADLNPPSVTSEWAVVTGWSCGARPPSCSVVRVAPARQCGFAGAGPAAVALTASPFLLRGGAPPRPWGGGGPRLWLPS